MAHGRVAALLAMISSCAVAGPGCMTQLVWESVHPARRVSLEQVYQLQRTDSQIVVLLVYETGAQRIVRWEPGADDVDCLDAEEGPSGPGMPIPRSNVLPVPEGEGLLLSCGTLLLRSGTERHVLDAPHVEPTSWYRYVPAIAVSPLTLIWDVATSPVQLAGLIAFWIDPTLLLPF